MSEYRRRVELRHDLHMLPIVSVLNLSCHLQHPDEQVRKLAERACYILAIYNACVRQVLENTDANMQRQDLLAHCIGPINNLFAHYGLYPHRPDEYDRGYWFSHDRLPNQDAYVDRDYQLVFGLDESTPYECESAIRDALADLEVPLPPRIFQHDH